MGLWYPRKGKPWRPGGRPGPKSGLLRRGQALCRDAESSVGRRRLCGESRVRVLMEPAYAFEEGSARPPACQAKG